MDKLVEKITLYDFVAMIIPGLMVILSIVSFFPKEFYNFYKDIGNVFVSSVLLLIISYCIGWIISELAQINFLILLENISNKITDLLKRFKRKQEKPENNKITPKLRKSYANALKEYFGEDISIDNIEDYAEMTYALVQTNSKYSRIHNYNSSKSFSKNLSFVCLILAITFILHAYQFKNEPYFIACIIAAIFFIIGRKVLLNRYKKFKEKVNIYNCIYFIDFVENYKNSKERNKNDILEVEIKKGRN